MKEVPDLKSVRPLVPFKVQSSNLETLFLEVCRSTTVP